MLRRQFLAVASAAPFLNAKSRIDMSRIAVLTDEVGKSPSEAIEFARKYGVKWLELRGIPGGKGHYGHLPEADLKQAAKEFADNGLKVSFLNTGFFKTTLPGTDPVFRKPEEPAAREKRLARGQTEYDTRKQRFEQAIRSCHIFDVDTMRVFTFHRVAEPKTVFQRVADVIGEMAEMCGKEGLRLAVENETPCNVRISSELADFVKLLPAKTVGINWDPLNEVSVGEVPYPDGYKLLPKKRIWNVQMKGHSLLDSSKRLDWRSIFAALERDGYKGKAGLETHYFDGTLIEKSHLSMQEIRRLVEHS